MRVCQHRPTTAALRICLVLSVIAAPLILVADTPPEQQSAIQAIQRWASNIQKNRDGTVRFIRFSKPLVTDAHVAHVSQFPELDYLAVVSPNVTDSGLSHVATLTNLDTLYLSQTQFSDRGLPALRGLKKLQRLYLDGTKVTDAGARHLSHLESLTTLSLADTAIGDATLEVIAKLTKLEVLLLSGTRITDTGLSRIAQLNHLRILDLSRTQLTGNGIGLLSKNSQLESLNLDATPLVANVHQQFSKHAALRQLSLRRTRLSDSAVEHIRKSHPQLNIQQSPARAAEQTALEQFLAKPKRHPAPTATDDATTQTTPELLPILAPVNSRFPDSDEVPDFQRHVIPLLGRLGCNGRTCHGSFQGRGGFRLSMFGYDFQTDLQALTSGKTPRIDRDVPDRSLIILKPTEQTDHEGGLRYKQGSWQHALLRRWIASGAPGVAKQRPHFVRLDVTPRKVLFRHTGDTVALRAIAVWSDGSREDVTPLTRFQTNDETVTQVDANGLMTSIGVGDTYVISFYDNGIFSTQTILPLSNPGGADFPDVPTPSKIDEFVVEKLSQLRVIPAELCTDSEFLRRVSLDIAGTLPTPDQITEFVADRSADKRRRMIEVLLAHPAHAEWWTNLVCDLTGMNAQFLGSTDMNRPAANQWRHWIHRRIADNVGWDRIVAGILLAQSRRPGQSYMEYASEQSAQLRREQPEDFTALDKPMHYYWFRSNITSNTDRALSFGYVFLGVRLDCAQCHKHPYDQWSQQDFTEFTEFFSRIRTGIAADAKPAQDILKVKLGVPDKLNTAALRRQMYMRVAAEGQPIPWNEIYVEPPRDKPHMARILGGPRVNLNDYADPREALMDWLTSEQQPYFARAIVNRVWSHYFHVGIVEPPDDFNRANPPSNKELLDYLTTEFVNQGYNLKWLHREITNSRTYQLSWRVNPTNRNDTRNFSHSVLRRLPAEVTIDAIIQSTANDTELKRINASVKDRKIAQHPLSIQARGIDYSLLVFGKPLRMTNCDCERQTAPTLLQSLYMRNDRELLGWLERPDGWLQQVAMQLDETLSRETETATQQTTPTRRNIAPAQVSSLIRQAYLRTLCRLPDTAEMSRATKHLTQAPNHVEGLRDLMWALINTQEFISNH